MRRALDRVARAHMRGALFRALRARLVCRERERAKRRPTASRRRGQTVWEHAPSVGGGRDARLRRHQQADHPMRRRYARVGTSRESVRTRRFSSFVIRVLARVPPTRSSELTVSHSARRPAADTLLAIVADEWREMNTVNVATAWHRLAKLARLSRKQKQKLNENEPKTKKEKLIENSAETKHFTSIRNARPP